MGAGHDVMGAGHDVMGAGHDVIPGVPAVIPAKAGIWTRAYAPIASRPVSHHVIPA